MYSVLIYTCVYATHVFVRVFVRVSMFDEAAPSRRLENYVCPLEQRRTTNTGQTARPFADDDDVDWFRGSLSPFPFRLEPFVDPFATLS